MDQGLKFKMAKGYQLDLIAAVGSWMDDRARLQQGGVAQ
jgi:hypothetical protein